MGLKRAQNGCVIKYKEVTNEKGISIYNKNSITIYSWYYMQVIDSNV